MIFPYTLNTCVHVYPYNLEYSEQDRSKNEELQLQTEIQRKDYVRYGQISAPDLNQVLNSIV